MSVIQRLWNKSPRYALNWYRARRHTEDAMASVDNEAFEKLKAFKHQTEHPHYRKYFNMPYWLRCNIQRALFLKLHGNQERLRVLDIGAGFGYFPHAAAFFGHDAVGLDIPGDRLFKEACEFLNVPRVEFTIEKEKPLPDFPGGPFDLITSFQVCFNDHYEQRPWGAPSWEYFVDHLIDTHLRPGGRIYLELNYHSRVKHWLPSDVRKLFSKKYNAKFNGYSRVTISK